MQMAKSGFGHCRQARDLFAMGTGKAMKVMNDNDEIVSKKFRSDDERGALEE
jgi:hypothetical protein